LKDVILSILKLNKFLSLKDLFKKVTFQTQQKHQPQPFVPDETEIYDELEQLILNGRVKKTEKSGTLMYCTAGRS